MARNQGISPRIYLSNQTFTTVNGFKVSPVQGQDIEALPPQIKNGSETAGCDIMQTPFSQFAFNHITPPDYGNDDCIARVTGIPINKPDFIADYHFISLARSIDYLLMHNYYQGKITGNYDTPGATK